MKNSVKIWTIFATLGVMALDNVADGVTLWKKQIKKQQDFCSIGRHAWYEYRVRGQKRRTCTRKGCGKTQIFEDGVWLYQMPKVPAQEEEI